MNHMLFIILESLLFVIAISTDAFVASLAYGNSKIKIPFISVQIISLICTGTLGLSLFFGVLLKPFLSVILLKLISFIILILLGIFKLMDNLIKLKIDKHNAFRKEIKFNLLNLNFILNIYANPKEADVDDSKILSPQEAVSLAIALSIDSLAAGVGAAFGDINLLAVILFSLILSMLSIKLGELIGYKLSNKASGQMSWLSGLLLILLAFLRFI